MKINRRDFIAAAAAATLLPASAHAFDAAGKTVDWLIPFNVGGGTDIWARFLAPYVQDNLPGKPSMVIRNVPGGGSLTGASEFSRRGKPDGLHLFGTSSSTTFPYLLGDSRANFNLDDWIVVMASPSGGVAYVQPDLGVTSAADMAKLKGKKLKYGSQGATSQDLVPLLAFELMGLDVEPVFGMKSRGEARLAFERGEAQIDTQTTSGYLQSVEPLVKAGKAVPLFSWGIVDGNGNFQRDPSFPNLPHFVEAYEMAYGRKPEGPAFEAFKAFTISGYGVSKAAFLPKGTPQEVVDAYTKAFETAVNTPGFREKAGDVIGDYPQLVGKEAAGAFKSGIQVAPATKEWVRNWLGQKYGTKFD